MYYKMSSHIFGYNFRFNDIQFNEKFRKLVFSLNFSSDILHIINSYIDYKYICIDFIRNFSNKLGNIGYKYSFFDGKVNMYIGYYCRDMIKNNQIFTEQIKKEPFWEFCTNKKTLKMHDINKRFEDLF
jgi:hypothetical protein